MKTISIYRILQIITLFVVFIIGLFFYLILSSDTKISDVFSTNRIISLSKRPSNFTHDIVIDLSFLGSSGGVKTLTENLIFGISQKRPNWRLILLFSNYSNKKFLQLTSLKNVKLVKVEVQYRPFSDAASTILNFFTFNIFKGALSQITFLNKVVIDDECDLCWSPDSTTSIIKFSIPKVSTVHDLAYKDVTSCLREDSKNWMKSHITDCILNDNKIITVSDFSKKRILEEFHSIGDRVKMIHIKLANRIQNSISEKQKSNVLNKYNIEKNKYLIFISAFWANKNHERLLKAFAKFLIKTNSDLKLVLVGSCCAYSEKFKNIAINSGISDKVVFTNFIPNEYLQILLSNALAFVHPSLYEGFGMSIIEAMNAKIPVACSNGGSIPEIAGDAAVFFDPYSVDDMAEAMEKVAFDHDLRQKLIQLGYQQAKKFSDTDFMINEYIKTFEETMQKKE